MPLQHYTLRYLYHTKPDSTVPLHNLTLLHYTVTTRYKTIPLLFALPSLIPQGLLLLRAKLNLFPGYAGIWPLALCLLESHIDAVLLAWDLDLYLR